MFPQAGIECGDTLDDMLGIVLHKAKTAKVGNQMHVSLSRDLFFHLLVSTLFSCLLTAVGLAQSIQRLSAERRSWVRFPGPDQHSGS